MHMEYQDITQRIGRDPVWWLDGVPRYCTFHPDEVGVYHREAALVRIEGQCPEGVFFDIGIAAPSTSFRMGLRATIAAYGTIYVGDPPNYRDRVVPHMLAEAIEIREFWVRDANFDWQRDHNLERLLVDETTHERLSPAYASLAADRAGEAWQTMFDQKDVPGLRAALVGVGCPDSDAESVAKLLVLEAIYEAARREATALMV